MTQLTALTREQIAELAPQVYTEHPHESVSKKYSFIPTYQVIEDMEKLGWLVSSAKSMRSKDAIQRKHGKHLVTFFNPDIVIKDANGAIEAYPQCVLVNNSRGWGKLQFEVGVFRLVCSNGMIIKSEDFGSFNLRHLGYSFEELKELMTKVVNSLPDVVQKINTYSNRMMTADEMKAFAAKALQARFGEEKVVDDSEINQILQATRKEDEGSSLWVVFNRTQEALVRGGFMMTTKAGKEKKVRAIKNMMADLDLNKKLWEVAETFA